MAILGIKSSVALSLISVWGIIQLAIMGGLLRIHSVAFAEDFEAHSLDEMEKMYDDAVSTNVTFVYCLDVAYGVIE